MNPDQAEKHLDSEEETFLPHEYQFHSKLQLRSPDEDLLVLTEVHRREMQYSQHEFVKMNEVGLLITEAVQGMLDKLQSKEIAIRDNKH